MSIITVVRRNLRQWSMRRLEQDIDWARASSDAHIRSLEQQLDRLRAHDTRSSQDVAREAGRREKGFA